MSVAVRNAPYGAVVGAEVPGPRQRAERERTVECEAADAARRILHDSRHLQPGLAVRHLHRHDERRCGRLVQRQAPGVAQDDLQRSALQDLELHVLRARQVVRRAVAVGYGNAVPPFADEIHLHVVRRQHERRSASAEPHVADLDGVCVFGHRQSASGSRGRFHVWTELEDVAPALARPDADIEVDAQCAHRSVRPHRLSRELCGDFVGDFQPRARHVAQCAARQLHLRRDRILGPPDPGRLADIDLTRGDRSFEHLPGQLL